MLKRFISLFCLGWHLTGLTIPLSVEPMSGLDFGRAIQGDFAVVVPASPIRSPQNAVFKIEGDPNRAYSIILPNQVVELTHIQGRGVIGIQQFQSFPAGQGNLDSNGRQILIVGATRNPISRAEPPGEYRGQFVIIVSY